MEFNFDKEYFQRTWNPSGYYERFSYGVGIDRVCDVALTPFFYFNNTALEIGCGGGTFTEIMKGKFKYLTVVDVIERPAQFLLYESFRYIEQEDKGTSLQGVEDGSIDFAFSYNLFCHLSNTMLKEYLKSVHRVLKVGGDFVFMIANFEHTKINVPDSDKYELGGLLPIGHFYQDDRTLDLIADENDWVIASRNMIPEHRDIIIHLKKK